MGTRGLIGIHSKQITKATYNHFDSYPSGIGLFILRETKEAIKKFGLDKLRERFDKIKLISDERKNYKDNPT